ncbi:FAD-dependent 5-carboxymethylaminomethyl-2-thiouridine(34) oxidoreductase MnmC [Neisseria leonii]|uniref:FAD-dependent 5-carboxymethylaminomethyl-2-thiouridine(34) oxidoreductase MnmC n=1 Tax=Neisseria leonii TaxID=2995413 RepID=UPI00237A94BB|nr:FAD-dependent 5-carboxymethylaminomethyl-2-thiouridine(34) oxidoreductase MnmC [Neisseria sp. 3986]MDD9325281.1 FAD-dependent 5-carboxymethylaminomethyl-2-thiouridine(34) oxidoreductase MnmC [Neisseria sp. 3986]
MAATAQTVSLNAVWPFLPPAAELLRAANRFRRLIVCLPQHAVPQPDTAGLPAAAAARWHQAFSAVSLEAASLFRHLIDRCELWLFPPQAAAHLNDYFSDGLCWQDTPIPQQPAAAVKPWFRPPPPITPRRIAVIGAGIAGAACARILAEHGIGVTVWEAGKAAHAASGNRQGLLYAKISPHPTEQTELLLGAYGHTRRALTRLLPDAGTWQPCGVLHLNHNAAEARRNAALGRQTHHRHLYYPVDGAAACRLAGIDGLSDGLFWPQGAWLHPPALIHALLDHPLITLSEHTPLQTAGYRNGLWHLSAPQNRLTASHIIFCTGADSPQIPLLHHLPWQLIRGQTNLAPADTRSSALKTALSGSSYISPAWQGVHCFGATFHPHNNDRRLHPADTAANLHDLSALYPDLAGRLNISDLARGHAAVRCDSPDHLPTVGPVGDAAAMRHAYARLADDKNLPLQTECPYLPGIWVSSGHGSRGLTTALWCAEALAADLLGLPNPLSPRLRAALHPNRHPIRAIVRS